jgi:hypothetical protein
MNKINKTLKNESLNSVICRTENTLYNRIHHRSDLAGWTQYRSSEFMDKQQIDRRMFGVYKTVTNVDFGSPNTPTGQPNRLIVPIVEDNKIVSYDIVKRVRVRKPFVGTLSQHKFT